MVSSGRDHVPVLAEEVLSWLRCKTGGIYLDCTVGYGALAERILERSAPDGRLIGIDQDESAIGAAAIRLSPFKERAYLAHGNFRDLKVHVSAGGAQSVDGVVFDLGVSSPQLDRAERGFSFSLDGPLDMRMDRRVTRTAADLIRDLPETELADLLYRFGEERYARRIARAIARARAGEPLVTTRQLVAVIERSVPPAYRRGRIHCATRTFQALRIAVNHELEFLEPALRDAAEVLVPGGRLCVMSFHSLEDRIVKRTMRSLARGPHPLLTVLTKKPLMATEQECEINRRARSAKLRVAERLTKECVS